MRPLPDTSCMTCASDTFSALMAMPASADATRIAVSTIVSLSANWPVGGSYAPSPYPVLARSRSRMRPFRISRRMTSTTTLRR